MSVFGSSGSAKQSPCDLVEVLPGRGNECALGREVWDNW